MSFLTPLHSKAKSVPFITMDIESKDGPTQKAGFTRPFLVGIYNGENYECFRDNNKGTWEKRYHSTGGCVDRAMRRILVKSFRGHHIYAHNAGRFDFLHILPWLMTVGVDLGFRFNLIPVASSIQILDVWRTRDSDERRKFNHWRFLDSYKLIPTSLDKAAKGFGLPGKLQHDLDLHEEDPRWIDYLREDCVQLYGVLEKFHHYIEHVLLGEVGVTAPSTAMKLFRRRYLKRDLQRNEHTHDFIRQGYFGGRVEVFRTSGEGLRYYDFNSSYPASMLHAMPGGEAVVWKGKPPDHVFTGKKPRVGFVKANVFVPSDIHIPPLPIRGKKELGVPEKLIFPTGRLQGIWEWEELSTAVKYGATIENWIESVWYEPVYLFREFVLDLYQYRDKSRPDFDQGLSEVVKIMLNSTYGKFGMKTVQKKIYRFDDPDLPDNATPIDGNPESLVWVADREVDAPYIIPQIAARVTALSRVLLYEGLMKSAGIKPGDKHYNSDAVFYCDTDSIITTTELPSSPALGALKDEYPEVSGRIRGRFIGPKLYLLEADGDWEKIKAKGLQKRTRENLEQLAAGNTIMQERLEKVGTLARAQFLRGPRVIPVPRTLRLEGAKRQMHEDGSTSPWQVNMW